MGILDKIFEQRDKENPVIDVSSEMNVIINDLIKHYQDYCNYDEILRISEKDRLPILQYIWSKWTVHSSSIEKDLKYTYPQYDFKDIRLITHKEHKRIVNLHKQKQAIEMFESGNKNCFFLQPFTTFSSNEERNRNANKNICLIYDIHKISDVWINSKGYLDYYFFGVCTGKINPDALKYYKFWVNGDIKHLTEQEFLEWCKGYGIDYPLYKEGIF